MILAYEQWVVRVFGLTLSYSNFAYIVPQKKKKEKKEEESRNEEEEEEVGTDAIFSSIYFSQHRSSNKKMHTYELITVFLPP